MTAKQGRTGTILSSTRSMSLRTSGSQFSLMVRAAEVCWMKRWRMPICRSQNKVSPTASRKNWLPRRTFVFFSLSPRAATISSVIRWQLRRKDEVVREVELKTAFSHGVDAPLWPGLELDDGLEASSIGRAARSHAWCRASAREETGDEESKRERGKGSQAVSSVSKSVQPVRMQQSSATPARASGRERALVVPVLARRRTCSTPLLLPLSPGQRRRQQPWSRPQST